MHSRFKIDLFHNLIRIKYWLLNNGKKNCLVRLKERNHMLTKLIFNNFWKIIILLKNGKMSYLFLFIMGLMMFVELDRLSILLIFLIRLLKRAVRIFILSALSLEETKKHLLLYSKRWTLKLLTIASRFKNTPSLEKVILTLLAWVKVGLLLEIWSKIVILESSKSIISYQSEAHKWV